MLCRFFPHLIVPFVTFTSFQERFKIKCNFLSYLQVISAIPKRLLQKAKSSDRRENLRAYKTTFPLTPSLNIDLYKMKCKGYYWLYINGTTALYCNRAQKIGKRTEIREHWYWKAKFNNIGKICHENRLREFNFKLLHR